MNSSHKKVIKNTYYSNWCDTWGYPLAYWLVKKIRNIPGLTPNKVTWTAFTLYSLGSLSLFNNYSFHNYIAAFLIMVGFVGDDMDGQLARLNKMSSNIGDFLDKVLDVLKIFIITSSAGFAAYLATGQVWYLFLGFVICFFFNFRYYIKLETMFSSISQEVGYLDKSTKVRLGLIEKIELMYQKGGNLGNFWHKNRTFFFFDEAEIALVVALGSIFQKLDIALWILAISQVGWGLYRFIERGRQINSNSVELYKPLRK